MSGLGTFWFGVTIPKDATDSVPLCGHRRLSVRLTLSVRAGVTASAEDDGEREREGDAASTND